MRSLLRILLIYCALILVLSPAVGIYAEETEDESVSAEYSIQTSDINYKNSPVEKFGRGVINAATCWAEVPRQAIEVSQEEDPFVGGTLGVFEGVLTGVVRCVTGVFEAVTCIVPPYDQPLMQPTYALEGAEKEMKEYLW
jgi:putative exosortase-associated protein (TIGR04073 family)